MDDREEAATFSVSNEGEIISVPDDPVSIVVDDQEGEPHGLLEQWDDEAWIYASVDALRDL